MQLSKVILSFLLLIPMTLHAGDKQESPKAVEGAVTINAAQAQSLFNDGIIFVDVRKDKDYEAGRIPDSVHLELKKVFNEQSLAEVVQKDQEFILYCNGHSCMRSSEASKLAVSWGFKNVRYFRDGFPAWKAAGYPVE